MASSSSAASGATPTTAFSSATKLAGETYTWPPEGALRLAFLLAAAVERDIDIR
ncbi:MAG TPA: hypothetical protein VK499_01010 [Propionibacteriaceae bacterium]|jgi:hypothetical protein|nr:hypothetical protein [Propionibacteriaceae bacterium]